MKKPLHLYQAGHAISARLQMQALLLIFFSFLIFSNAHAQNLPPGFSQVMVANGISNPTVMAFAPDGRIFVAQQTGQVRVIKNGALLSQPFVSLSVHSSGERGLLGIAFDPNFNSNRYVYLYYTISSGAYNRISRFTANGDVAVSGSEQVILNLDPLSGATNHNGGNMQFGPDGKLYVGIGENADAALAQTMDTYHGKLLRINADGSVPPGNPFTSGSNQRQRIWAYGLRNPYTIAFQPGTGKLFVNDVGGNTWEEINDATSGGKNFGWPYAEGGNSNYSNPVYAYGHGSSVGTGCAITGGTFFNPSTTNYPSTYIGRYFYMDFCNNWIDMLTISGSSVSRSNFASNIAGSSLSLVTGTDGNLYFLSRNNSAVYKIVYNGTGSAPVITNQPQSITVAQGNNASFSVSASGTSLSYQWRRNGNNISGATSATYNISNVTSSHAGTYSVVISNTNGSVTSSNATLTVTSPNQAPTASITTPATGSTYSGGNVINFSGTATDPESGTLGSSAYQWYVLFHHDTHNHPGPTVTANGSSGSFTIPTSGETATNVFYRLFLVVTDPQGAKDTTYRDILPRTSTITINTNPQGLRVTLDGQPYTAPYTVSSVEGVVRSIGVSSPQTLNGSSYNFSNWSHGGSQTQNIATPVNNTSYTANFTGATAAPVITAQPQSLSVVAGNSANFSVTATGSAPLSYQWRRNGTNISGATGSSYGISSVSTTSAGSYSVVVSNAAGSVTSNNATLTVTSSGGSGTAVSLFGSGELPSSPRSNDGQGISLGMKFRTTQNGVVNGIRYYKGPNTTGTRTGYLWSSSGAMLASVTFSNETESGWQQALFSSPVPVTAGLTYVASYHSPSGFFAATGSYFNSAKVNGPVRGLANGEDGPNGLYRYSASPVFPNNGYNSSNYWVDILFTPGSGADITAPVVTSVSPTNGTTGVSVNPTITANFSEAINASTISASTVQLKAGAAVIPTTITLSASGITISTSSALSYSSVYTVLLKGGSSGIKDLAGNALTSDYSWTFTTGAGSGASSYTLFQTTDRPEEPLANDSQGGIVVGTKFRSSQSGFITGIRFYKGAGAGGTHTGTLWSSNGTQLASAGFTNQTSSGWQQVSFTNPVSIAAGITYVVSVFSSSGDYCATDPYFTQATVNGPLRALANGEDGPNGLYRYTNTNEFPNFSYNASNYWVDVVFVPASITGSSTASRPGSTELVSSTQDEIISKDLEVTVMPNPSNTYFTVIVNGDNTNSTNVRVFDPSGKVLEKHERIPAGQNLQIGSGWRSGFYFVEVIKGKQRKFIKVIKTN